MNPYTFSWDDGSRYFMWGQTYYDVMRLAMVSDSWKVGVDKSVAYASMSLLRATTRPRRETCASPKLTPS